MIVGIDLGTTNSAVAVWRNGRAELIPNSMGHVLTPSAVSLDDDGGLLVGLPARERQSTHPRLTATAFKRYMGSARTAKLGDRSYLPEELSALVLRALKADAEALLGAPVTEAVITVPAYFNDKQRKATRRAGELAGLKVERLLNEPTAAALAYGIHELGAESQFLVFDLGGGTFDVSVLEIFEGVIEVRASTGDNRLGGEDFNDLLVQGMAAKFAKEWGTAARDKDALRHKLLVAAERARRALTESAAATMTVIWEDKAYDWEVAAEDFEDRATPLLARLREPVLRALRDGGVQAAALKEIVLVGGGTRMPVVRRAVTKMFARFPSTAVNPDEAVAIGAAIQAGLKARDAALQEVVLTDVCPYSLGVDSAEHTAGGGLRTGVFSPIIERNTVVPASRSQIFSTMQTGQRKVAFNIYQGESRQVSENIHLGKIEVPVPPGRAGEVFLECRFTYDINGLLEVDVHVPATGERRELVIFEQGELTEADLQKRREALAALKVHPRDADANRAALARAFRCYESFLGEKREYVGRLASQFEAAIDTQELRTIDQARKELLAALDQLEGETYMSASIWSRLGLKRTRDKAAVRRAYAAKLKAAHPEDDPEGFKALRLAYEQALVYAEGGFDEIEEDWSPEAFDGAADIPAEAAPAPELSVAISPHAAACAHLQALLAGPRADADGLQQAAEAVLSSPALEAVDVERRTEAWIARVLLEHAPQSDPLIWPVMTRFGWDRPQSADADPIVRQLVARRDALIGWAAASAPVRKALRQPPGLFTWTRILSGDLADISRRVATFGQAPPADMSPQALAWWGRYFSRPRPPVGGLWTAIILSVVVVVIPAIYLADDGHYGYLPIALLLIGGPAAAALSVGLAFQFIEAVNWPRRLLAQRWFFRAPAWVRLGWAPAAVVLMLAAAVVPDSLPAAVATAVIAGLLVLWSLVLGEPDRRSLRFHWFVSGLMLQAYIVIWWVVVTTLPYSPISPQLSIAFAGAVACAVLGGGSLMDSWIGEVAERHRLPGLLLLALAGVAAELLLVAAHASRGLLPMAAVLLATVVFAAKAVAGLLGSGPLALRHRLMWYAMIGFNIFRSANPEWAAVVGGAWLLTGVGIAIAGATGPEIEVWRSARRNDRLAPRKPG